MGGKGQKKLLESRALVVGAGGLGTPAGLYLVAAGVGILGGGCAEAEIWQVATRVIKTRVPERLHLELIDDGTGLTTMICGRTLDVFIEPIAADVSKQSKDTLLLPTPDEGDDICHILGARAEAAGQGWLGAQEIVDALPVTPYWLHRRRATNQERTEKAPFSSSEKGAWLPHKGYFAANS